MRAYSSRFATISWFVVVLTTVPGCQTSDEAPGSQRVCEPSCTAGCGKPDGCGAVCPCDHPSDEEETPESPGACTRVCDGTSCEDGCGGVCACPSHEVCDGKARCVAQTACTDSCVGTGHACGNVCGESCGTCGDGLSCLDGQCLGPMSCADCGLQLAVRDAADDTTIEVEVRLAPAESDPRPRMVDLRVRPSRPLRLLSAEAGPAMIDAGKSFYFDAGSGESFKRRKDGSYQLLIHGFESATVIGPGRLLTLRFQRDNDAPVSFALEKRAQTFAPASADAALQTTPYGHGVVAR